MAEREEPGDNSPVRCSPDRGNWFLVLFIGGIGLIAILGPWLTPTKPGDKIMLNAMGSLFMLPALLFAAWLLRAQIIADSAGLHWRGLAGWRTAAWEDITDYYDKLLAKKGVTAVIEIGEQKLQISKSWWKENPAWRGRVEQRARQARANTWGVWGTRPELDWPRVFGYQSRDNRGIAFLFRYLGLGALLWGAGLTSKVTQAWMTLGWQWGLVSIGALLLGVCPLLLYLILFQSTSGDLRRRWKQQIAVDLGGLTFEAEGTRLRASWEEVSDFFVAPRAGFNISPTLTVVTKRGTFDFSGAISDVGILSRIIADNSTAAATRAWRSRDDDVLGGAASRWTSGCEGVGERVFHYRTRTNRALLWFPTAMALIPALTASLASMGLMPKPDWYGIALAWGMAIWCWWRYYAASIQTDGVGITQHTVWGRRFLCWDQVEQFYTSGGDAYVFGNVVGGGTRIWFWIGIADVEELKNEIARRATHSRNRTWNEEQESRKAAKTI